MSWNIVALYVHYVDVILLVVQLKVVFYALLAALSVSGYSVCFAALNIINC